MICESLTFHPMYNIILIDIGYLRKYDAIVKSGIPILKRYDLPGKST